MERWITNRWMDGWMDGWMDRWIDWLIDWLIDLFIYLFIYLIDWWIIWNDCFIDRDVPRRTMQLQQVERQRTNDGI